MNIRADDILKLEEMLAGELNRDSRWTAYEEGIRYDSLDRFKFFQTKDEAINYCFAHIKDNNEMSWVDAVQLLGAVRQISREDNGRKDIDKYYIDDVSFETSRILKIHKDRKLIENFGLLTMQLNRQGFDYDYFLNLEKSMKKGAARLEERYYNQLESELVMTSHLFTRNEDGNYSMDKITGTLYYSMAIDHEIINGINTQELESRMVDVNWEIIGSRVFEQMEPMFKELCEDANGRVIAVQLFNNHVPPYWVYKPDFLRRAEEELIIYPRMVFPGESTAAEIYEGLKTNLQIRDEIKKHSIDSYDELSKTLLVKKLMEGQICSLVAPSGPRQGDDVLLSWNTVLKVFEFIFKDEPKLDARLYFDKRETEQFKNLENDLRQYPIRQGENERHFQNLVLAILEGQKKTIHLEKTIVPAELIEKYVVIERSFLNNTGNNFIAPIEHFTCTDLSIAKGEMYQLSERFMLDDRKADSILVLAGQYKGKELQYDPEGNPVINTAFQIGLVNNFSCDGYIVSKFKDLNTTETVTEQIFVQRGIAANKLVYSNKHGQSIDIDKEFWTPEQSGLNKKQSANDEGLIKKQRSNTERGQGRTM